MKQFSKLKSLIFIILCCFLSQSKSFGQTLNPSSISTNGSVNAIAQDSTSIYIGGNFTTAGYKAAGVALLNSSGKNISSFPSIGGTIYTTIADNAGGWFVGGAFSYQGKVNLIHILANNTIDASFNCNTNAAVRSLILDGNSLYIGGDFSQINSQSSNYLALADATTGNINLSWNPNPNSYVYTLLKDNNKLYIGGAFTNIANSGNRYFAVIDIVSATFIPAISTKNTVNTIKQDNNNIYIGGSFATENGFYTGTSAVLSASSDIPNHNFPKIDGSTITSISDGNGGWFIGGLFSYQGKSNLIHVLPDNTIDNNFAPNPNNYPQTLYLDGSTLYVGGSFTQIGGQNINYLASVNAVTGAVNTSWNPNPNGTIASILKDNNKLYVGGGFTDIGNSGNRYFATIDINTGGVLQSISTQNRVNVIKQDNDNIYVGGSYGGVNGFYTGSSALFPTSSDLPNPNFPKITGQILTTISDGNGGWYIGGTFTYQTYSNLIHLFSNNTIDSSFAPNPDNTVKALVIDANTLYVGGVFAQINGQSKNFLAAINASTGILNTSWNPNPNNIVNTLEKSGNTLFVAGLFSTIGGQSRNYLASVDATSGLASLWNPNPDSSTITKLLANSNDLIVCGGFTTIGGQAKSRLAKFDITSGLVASWNPNANSTVNTIEINGSNIYVGGAFTTIGGQTRNRIAEIDLVTGIATSWNPNANGAVNAINLSGTSVYVGGDFSTVGGQSRKYLASINSADGSIDSWDPVPSGSINIIKSFNSNILVAGSLTHTKAVSRNNLLAISKANNLISNWNPNPNSQVLDMEISGTSIYVGGSFAGIGGQSRNYLGEIDINTGLATSWNPNPNSQVSALKIIDNIVYVGGSFTTVGGQTRNGLAALNSSNDVATNWNPQPNSGVSDISIYNNSLCLTGGFKFLKTEIRNGLLAISKTDNLITNWNPAPPVNQPIYALEIEGDNIYVGGGFNAIGGQSRNNLAKINRTTGLADQWNPNLNAEVNTIKLIGSSLYVGGNFTTIGGQSRNYLGAINPIDATVLIWNPKPNSAVLDIQQSNQDFMIAGSFTFVNTEQRNNLLKISKADNLITDWNPSPNNIIQSIELNGLSGYFGGGFTSIGGQSRNRIAEINLNSGLATSWNPNSNGEVRTMKFNSNILYVGGSFSNIGGQTRNNLAALDTIIGTATSWSPNPNAPVNKLAVSNNTLYVAGNYTNITGQTRNRLASFTTSDGLLTTWNPDVSGNINDMFITGSSIYIGGAFTQISGQPRSYIASFTKNAGILKNWKPTLNGSVTSLLSYGKYMYVGGSFTSSGGQTCSGFTIIDSNTGFPKLYFPAVPTCCQITNMSANDNQIYLGGNFLSINSIPYGGFASISFGDSYFIPTVDSITPNSGGNIGLVSLVINGNGFQDGTIVKLKKSGQQDISLEDIYIGDNVQIFGKLNLMNKQIGMWDIEVSIPNDPVILLSNSFEVKEGIEPTPWTEIVGFNAIRVGQWQSYNLTYGNSGNIDALGVPIWFSVSDNAELQLDFQFQKPSDVFEVQDDPFYDTIPPYFNTDMVVDVPGPAKLVGVYIPNIPSNSGSSLAFKVKVNAPGPVTMNSWAGPERFDAEGIKPWVNPCDVDVVSLALTLSGCIPIPQVALAAGIVDCALNAYQAVEYFRIEENRTFLKATGILYTGGMDCALNFVPGADCIKDLPRLQLMATLATKSLFNLAQTNGDISTIPAYAPFLPNCFNPKIRAKSWIVQTISPADPNYKLGPTGYGLSNYLDTSKVIPYTIKCENDPAATAAAQNVRIIDVLDQSIYDLSSFQLGSISIRDTIIPVPSGLKHFETDVDLRPSNNIIARIVADLDMATGTATWTFKSIDPLTLLETQNPFAGILPPNINGPEGEAAVMFTIKTLPSIANDVAIRNKASIFFDSNDPIITNEWFNTSDIVKPVSLMNQTISNSNLTINLSWSGSDVGSGVQYYFIYYSKNGQPFEVLQGYVNGTTYSFEGELGQSYSFYTIATDNVGNIEDMKTVGEAQITLGTNQNEFFKGVTIYPNPNKGNFTLFINSNNTEPIDLSITDILGRNILTEKHTLKLGENYIPVNISENGIYFVCINNKKSKVVKKVIIKN